MSSIESQDYIQAIEQFDKLLRDACRNKALWQNDEIILQLLNGQYSATHAQIHSVYGFTPYGKSEEGVRDIIRKYVVGCKDKDTNKVYMGVLPIIENKMRQLSKSKTSNDLLVKYNNLYDDFYALAAYRSLKHFAIYMEWDLPEDKRIFNMTLNCFEGYWYYANQAILDFKYNKLFSQAPTGYGKSYKDTVTMAFILGKEPTDADILKVAGNPANIAPNSNRLVKYMLKPRFAKVFPYYAQFDCEREKMFDICQIGGNDKPTRLLVHGSEKGESLLFCNKATPIDGNRYKYKFYDDVTKSKDKANLTQHEKDVDMYTSEWERRKYDDFHNVEFFSGTAYHNEDFLCTIKRRNGADSAVVSPINKYTRVNEKFKSVFVAVPKLDYDTDKITFPQMYSEETAKKKRDENPREFYSMDQQEPMPIEGCPFDYKNLQTFSVIPEMKVENGDANYAVLDPARTGANYVTMIIFSLIGGLFYLKDVVFEMRPIEELHNEIVEKLIKHKVIAFHIERNTDTSLKTLLEKMTTERGYYSCLFSEIYSTKNKNDKIASAEATIRNRMVFPEFNLFGIGFQMRNFMRYFTSYSYLSKNKFDDAPDAVAMFAEKFIKSANSNSQAYTVQL